MAAPYSSALTKTTFLLSDSRRARLKSLATARKTTVTELLAEGADLVLEKYERLADKSVLVERAQKAKEELRRGLFGAEKPLPPADQVIYGAGASPRPRAARAGNRKR